MRIEGLQIDGFGHFHRREFRPLESPLTVLYGSNEAGKSTMLDFIRTMLFGFSGPSKLAFHPPLAGGQHGGKITLRSEDGRQYIIERRPGVHGGTIRVTSDKAQVFETDAELRRLLGHATEAMYQNVFAFGLGELQTSRSLDGPEVTGQIYNAGLGAASLPKALAGLKDGAEKLFKPGGSTQTVADILSALQSTEKALDEVRGDSAEYGRLSARIGAIAGELVDATAETARLSRHAAELDRLRKGWAEWLPLVELRTRRAQLPATERFPQSALARLESSEKRVREADDGVREARAETEAAAVLATQPIPGEALLPDAAAIEQVRRQRKSFDDSLRDLPKREQEASGKEGDLRSALASLGETWDRARVVSFDLSIAIDSQLAQWQKQLDEAEREALASGIRARADADAESDAKEKLAEARKLQDAMPGPARDAAEIADRRAVIRETRTALDERLRARANREEIERQIEDAAAAIAPSVPLPNLRALGIAAALMAVVAIGAGLVLGGNATLLGLLIGLPLFGIAAFALRPARRPSTAAPLPVFASEGRMARAATGEAAAQANLDHVAAPLGALPRHQRDLDALDLELDTASAALAAWGMAQDRVDTAQRNADSIGRRAEASQKLSEDRAARQAELVAGWRGWLATLRLPDLLPVPAAKMLDQIGYAQKSSSDVDAAGHRVAAIEADIRAYRDQVTALASPHGLVVGDAPFSPGEVADELCRRFDLAVRAAASREAATAKLAECRHRLKLSEDRLAESRAAMEALLASAGATDSEELRRLDALHTEALSLDQQIREAEQKLVMLSGPGSQFNDFLEKLAGTTIGDVEAESSEVLGAHTAAAALRDQLLDERGAASTRLADLSSDATGSELMARRETLIEQLNSAAREWSTLTLARHLLERARAKYEAERQPAVLKHAQSFFRAVTDGRYQTLISPLGTHNVTIIGQDNSHKTPEQLSRGTQEQLYLALRFGLIRQFAESAEPLPVVVDDILVNFDPERAYRTAQAFVELSQTNQVLVFTCHPETVALFTKADPRTQVIDLSDKTSLAG